MKTNTLFVAATLSVLLLSCKESNSGVESDTSEIQVNFSGNIHQFSRVSGTNWDANDNIGVFMATAGTTTLRRGVENWQYQTTGDGTFSPVVAANTVTFPINDDFVDFIAYYPYRATVISYFVVENWNTTDQNSVDLFLAKTERCSKNSPNVELHFKHQFCKLVLSVTPDTESGLTCTELAGMTAQIRGINKPVTFDLVAQTMEYGQPLDEAVGMVVSEDGLTASAIIPPILGNAVVFTLSNGKTYSWDISNVTFEAGSCYTYSVKLKNANTVEAQLAAVIDDWTNVDGGSVDANQSEELEVTTLYGHEYVDLGLPSGTLWATCNVGATNPWELGDYFAWGETEPYYIEGHSQDENCENWKEGKSSGYDWDSYQWCYSGYSGTDSPYGPPMTKYCDDSRCGTVDNKTVLERADDAATANWGAGWRMPTHQEFVELLENTSCKWTVFNGVYGCKVMAKNGSGNSIFLPAAGSRYGVSLYGVGSYGAYWSSSLYSNTDHLTVPSSYANNLDFNSAGISDLVYSHYNRHCGHSVRPVR